MLKLFASGGHLVSLTSAGSLALSLRAALGIRTKLGAVSTLVTWQLRQSLGLNEHPDSQGVCPHPRKDAQDPHP